MLTSPALQHVKGDRYVHHLTGASVNHTMFEVPVHMFTIEHPKTHYTKLASAGVQTRRLALQREIKLFALSCGWQQQNA